LNRSDIYFTEHGSGPPLVLVHGVMATGAMFGPVVDALAKRHRLVIPDLRGSGRSRHLPPPYSVKQQAADLSRLLDHLGIPCADVLGYSQGGPVAQQLALDYSARVRRLVLSNTYAYNMATMKERVEGRIAPVLIRLLGLKRFATLVVAQGLKRVSAAQARWVIDMIADQHPDLMIAAWKEAMAFDSRHRLREIGCPALIIAGADDNAVPMHHATLLHAGIEGSQLVVIEHADHALVWAQPERLVHAVETFLS
jgi:pimeloyl-ACP methyl ester carboxylesterase